ncbi:MAG: hypothetical protein R3C49_13730 [Planctomycetaceae bacterium]
MPATDQQGIHPNPEGIQVCRLPWLKVLCGYGLLSIVVTWPLVRHLDTHVPLGDEHVATVPLLNVWTVWWNADRASNLWQNYWDAPIFAPERSTFLLSEAQPVTAIVGPMAAKPGTVCFAYNLYLLKALTLNGFSGWLLFSWTTQSRLAGFFGGTVMVLLPFVHWQLGVLQLVPVFPSLLVIYSLCRFSDGLRWRWAMLLGSSLAWTYASCNYYGLFLSLLLPLSALPLLWRRLHRRSMWVGAGSGLLVFIFICWPIINRQLIMSRDRQRQRTTETIWNLSAAATDYVRPAHTSGPAGFPLSPGISVLALAVGGSAHLLARQSSRRFALMFILMAGAAFLFSLGPRWHILSRIPYMYLVEFVPGVSQIRSPYRAAVLVQIAATGLMCFSVERLQRLSRTGRPRQSVLATGALLISGLIVIWEIYPRGCPLTQLPAAPESSDWPLWISTHTPEESILLPFPLPAGKTVDDYEPTAVQMYYSMWHRRRLATGYSGFFPQPFREVSATFQESAQLSPLEIRDRLIAHQIDFCVVPESSVWQNRLRQAAGISEVYRDHRHRVVVFQVMTPSEKL